MSTNPTSVTPASGPAQSGPDLVRIVSLVVAGLVLAAALWMGVTSSRVAGSAASHPAARPTIVATVARPTILATATPAGAAAAAQATPSADQSAAWYLQQETHESDYCQCGNTH